jgi:nucleoside-diphosphate-sugar epimerase
VKRAVYGPRGRPDMALFMFARNILEGKPIDVFNNGHHKRNFTFVEDIAERVVRVLERIPQPDPSSQRVGLAVVKRAHKLRIRNGCGKREAPHTHIRHATSLGFLACLLLEKRQFLAIFMCFHSKMTVDFRFNSR